MLEAAQKKYHSVKYCFLVNGRLAPTPPPFLMPFDYFKRLIEEELSEQAKGGRPAGR